LHRTKILKEQMEKQKEAIEKARLEALNALSDK
jgi:hypothetical protein